jgi:PAS domain-containing protein
VSGGTGEQFAWVQDVPGGIVVLVGGEVVAANPAAGRAFGRPSADLFGTGLLDAVARGQRADVERALVAACADRPVAAERPDADAGGPARASGWLPDQVVRADVGPVPAGSPPNRFVACGSSVAVALTWASRGGRGGHGRGRHRHSTR